MGQAPEGRLFTAIDTAVRAVAVREGSDGSRRAKGPASSWKQRCKRIGRNAWRTNEGISEHYKRMLSATQGRVYRFGAWLLVFVAALLSAFPGLAGQERYDYDGQGRLVRVIDELNRVTGYVYDAAGNLLQVVTDSQTAQPIAVTGVSPSFFRQGDVKPVVITGTNLAGVSVVPSDPALDISGLRATATQVSFTLTVPSGAALGNGALRLTSAAGSANAAIAVGPPLPKIQVDPTPLAIPPDNTSHQFTVRLSNTDLIDHTIGLAASNGSFAVSPTSVTIPAGQMSAQAGIKGISGGLASLLLSSATLGNTSVPVFVTTEFVGISTSYSGQLGVVLQSNSSGGGSGVASQLVSRGVGIVIGSYLGGVAPNAFALGSGPTLLTVNGVGLEAAQSVAIVPNTGVTLGAVSVAPDGKSLSVPLTVAADAPISPRRVVVKNAAGVAYPVAVADADRINVVRLPPEIISIDPLFGTPGTTMSLTIRGRNLQDVLAVTVDPANAITVDALPQVNGDGTVVTVNLAIGPTAASGPRTVRVQTPGGSSTGTAGAANTFSVVNEIQGAVTPVVSSPVGVLLQSNTSPSSSSVSVFTTSALGVAVGPVATGIAPNIGIIGQSVSLTVQGSGLNGVNAVQLVPATGLTVGSPTVAPDGKSLTVPVAVDASAPQTWRTVRLLAGTAVIPFAAPDTSLFRVAAPAPVLDSVTPNYLQTGQSAVTFTVRGTNLQGATAVRLEPAGGVTVANPPTVNADGTSLTVNITASAAAATGPRALVVTTPGGDSSTVLSASDTVTLTANPGPTMTPVVSAVLGVTVGNGASGTSTDIGPIISPLLGVTVGQPAPASPVQFAASPVLGVARGPVATGIEPTGFAPATNGTLVIHGYALDAATGVSVNPAAGISLGTPTIAPDGGTITVPITIAADAAPTVREVIVNSAGSRIPFGDASASRFKVGPGTPRFDSITPILATQGDHITMTIRGANFGGTMAVKATPAAGIQISATPTVDPTGTIVTVDMQVAPDAPLGARVIQVLVPGAASSAEATPMNTFTVYAP